MLGAYHIFRGLVLYYGLGASLRPTDSCFPPCPPRQIALACKMEHYKTNSSETMKVVTSMVQVKKNTGIVDPL